MYRVGLGYDVHRFAPKRKLVLGGVEIPYNKGLDGHSDADVLLHAICDALLGGIGQGDIGEHFPNTDEQYRDIASSTLLEQVMALVHKAGFKVANMDAMLIAEEPNLKDHKSKMCELIASGLKVDSAAVNIKATTNEGLGFIGRKEGIAAMATVLLFKEDV